LRVEGVELINSGQVLIAGAIGFAAARSRTRGG